MSRPFLGYIGTPNFTEFTKNLYQGVATLADKDTLGKFNPPLPTSLKKPTAYGAFYGSAATNLSDGQLTTGILIDGNASSNPDYPGAYKLYIGEDMTLEFHLWGSGGGGNGTRGSAGYTKYVATFVEGTELGLYLPGYDGVPSTNALKQVGQWPDGGPGGTHTSNHGFSGGGSARVGLLYGDLATMNASNAVYYAIAGGGGGNHMHNEGAGAGGGTNGVAGIYGGYSAGGGGGGSQSAGGAGGAASSYGGTGQAGSKYQGGIGVANGTSFGGGGGGGGGYYGGGSGGTVYASGGGGSGYVNTSYSGYSSGFTNPGSTSDSPIGSGYTKPTNAGKPNKTGAIYFKKV